MTLEERWRDGSRWSVSRVTTLAMSGQEITELHDTGSVVLGAHGGGEVTGRVSLFQSNLAAVRRIDDQGRVRIAVFDDPLRSDDDLISSTTELLDEHR